ncbi:hypothetical protein PMKS-000180 [Pichia membranifaciens]|uniref:Uncharacterized protein n=1 Tax=Pichia membranifaciens TaxID=4926 RepID=A0A1Q2YB11_9ASCO|nr:hypothetical protein PMKS-000180 [Pichia membranifaciens]
MENLAWEELESLATSSPKKGHVQTKTNHGSTVLAKEGNNNNIELGEFNLEFFDKQPVNSRSLSPVRLPVRNGANIATKEEKVTSFERDNGDTGLSNTPRDKSTHEGNGSESSDEEDPRQHRKNLRRLIHEIHKLPYNSDWNVREWHLLQEYLNEWKLSEDDDMLKPVVLRDLFNCTVAELEIRIGSLKKFVHWKQRKVGESFGK